MIRSLLRSAVNLSSTVQIQRYIYSLFHNVYLDCIKILVSPDTFMILQLCHQIHCHKKPPSSPLDHFPLQRPIAFDDVGPARPDGVLRRAGQLGRGEGARRPPLAQGRAQAQEQPGPTQTMVRNVWLSFTRIMTITGHGHLLPATRPVKLDL